MKGSHYDMVVVASCHGLVTVVSCHLCYHCVLPYGVVMPWLLCGHVVMLLLFFFVSHRGRRPWLVVAGEGLCGPGSSLRCHCHPVSQRVGLGRMWATYLDVLKNITMMNNVCCSSSFGCDVAPGFHF
jgi:hypothetical protein